MKQNKSETNEQIWGITFLDFPTSEAISIKIVWCQGHNV